jgi:hypothetical protein
LLGDPVLEFSWVSGSAGRFDSRSAAPNSSGYDRFLGGLFVAVGGLLGVSVLAAFAAESTTDGEVVKEPDADWVDSTEMPLGLGASRSLRPGDF